ncbi:hypothetical protein FRB94_013716 [Tulasnella sp. JGI-2019a]|nr:hypothetical protein FRB93_011126 [Tulasnella sp. JGI-2019a]KAG8990116.1 hypothetical protein FRB94_013716 [Tulasnella sp. JGI-2019a]
MPPPPAPSAYFRLTTLLGSPSLLSILSPLRPLMTQAESKAKMENFEEDSNQSPVDIETFQHILDLDDEGDSFFSKGIVEDYYSEADYGLLDMEEALARKDLNKLSSLGGFLERSSTSLGATKVQATCQDTTQRCSQRGSWVRRFG